MPPVTPMQHIPLYFDLRHIVAGQGFIAAVRMRGRATGVEDFGSIWIYGVNPGGIAEHGPDLKSAYANFRRFLVGVMSDLAEDAADFIEFRAAVSDFLEETNAESVAEWTEARDEVRKGHVPKVDLPREGDDLSAEVEVDDLSNARPPEITPAINEPAYPQERLAA